MNILRKLVLASLLALIPVLAFAAKIDLNTSSVETLQTLDGVGPVKAEAIVAYRQAKGGFASVDELVEVRGIGEHTVQLNRDSVMVE